jgi:hypothetical protein
MDKNLTLFAMLIFIMLINLFLTVVSPTWYTPINQIAKDTNTLLANDLAMANYIQANSTTVEYLNKNCKQTADTNTTITLTCFKVVQ